MALKDCLKKMKGQVSKQDIVQLEQYIAEGLTDQQAVRKLVIGSHQNVIDIADRARTEGVELAAGEVPVVKFIELQERNLEKVNAELSKLAGEMDDLKDELGDILLKLRDVLLGHLAFHFLNAVLERHQSMISIKAAAKATIISSSSSMICFLSLA